MYGIAANSASFYYVTISKFSHGFKISIFNRVAGLWDNKSGGLSDKSCRLTLFGRKNLMHNGIHFKTAHTVLRFLFFCFFFTVHLSFLFFFSKEKLECLFDNYNHSALRWKRMKNNYCVFDRNFFLVSTIFWMCRKLGNGNADKHWKFYKENKSFKSFFSYYNYFALHNLEGIIWWKFFQQSKITVWPLRWEFSDECVSKYLQELHKKFEILQPLDVRK